MVSFVYFKGNKSFCSVDLDSDSDVRVGPDIVTDPAFLVTRLVSTFCFVFSSFVLNHLMEHMAVSHKLH